MGRKARWSIIHPDHRRNWFRRSRSDTRGKFLTCIHSWHIYDGEKAINSLIERQAPGLVHLLISSSLKHTPLAALSRPVAGTYKDTMIITLPGSVKAVTENISCLLAGGLLLHALDLISGGSGRAVHRQLAEVGPQATPQGGDRHTHHHHHHHHDAPKPRTAVSHDPSKPGAEDSSAV